MLIARIKSYIHRSLRWLLKDVVNDIRLHSYLVFGQRQKLKIHPSAVVQNTLFNVESGTITVEAFALFGHNVSLLTGEHDITKFNWERQSGVPRTGNDIVVRRGAWIATNAVVIGPCEIGEHAVVAAGSVVIKDVPPFAVVGGNPAKIIKWIKSGEAKEETPRPSHQGTSEKKNC
jgi:acetyltransferase-like isoleucine patch superfamily enzyme